MSLAKYRSVNEQCGQTLHHSCLFSPQHSPGGQFPALISNHELNTALAESSQLWSQTMSSEDRQPNTAGGLNHRAPLTCSLYCQALQAFSAVTKKPGSWKSRKQHEDNVSSVCWVTKVTALLSSVIQSKNVVTFKTTKMMISCYWIPVL